MTTPWNIKVFNFDADQFIFFKTRLALSESYLRNYCLTHDPKDFYIFVEEFQILHLGLQSILSYILYIV